MGFARHRRPAGAGLGSAPPRGRKRYPRPLPVFAPALLLAVAAGSLAQVPDPEPGPLGRWVDPFVGTGGIPWVSGMNSPAATVPFGMVRLGPESAAGPGARFSVGTAGYHYGETHLRGFSHTRLLGTGVAEGGLLLVVPTLGPVAQRTRERGQWARFSHVSEAAAPGSYAVRLLGWDILAELTATPRSGAHRYSFPGWREAHLLLDLNHGLGGGRAEEAELRVLPEAGEVEGRMRLQTGFSGRYGGLPAWFVARFDRPFSRHGVWRGGEYFEGRTEVAGDAIGADLGFGTAADGARNVVELRVGLSYVSLEGARANLETEAEGTGFDELRARARELWEEALGAIRIEGATEERRSVFYTALYRALQMPTLFGDASGEYRGFDGAVHRAEGFSYLTDLSLWDTFRTQHPLLTLVAPERQRDALASLVAMAEQGGALPRWPSGAGYTNSMLGTPADIAVAESYRKGIRDFDVETAFEAMLLTAEGPPDGTGFSGREGIEDCLAHGYCPADLMDEAVARTLEFAHQDRAIAELAEALGRYEEAERFRERSMSYRELWNPATGYFQPRNADGSFAFPFFPLLLTYLDPTGVTNDYVEGSALQWRWSVPFDPEGLIGLFGGPAVFAEELADFFEQASPERARPTRGRTTGTGTSRTSTRRICSTRRAGRSSPSAGFGGSWTTNTGAAPTGWTATTMAGPSRPGTSGAP